ncbi:MAG: hypothetical protein HYZ39_20215 [Mycolicibacterium cosmeticum]|nr:hypothetical protein [Mycolicibacterium cosmeticum]
MKPTSPRTVRIIFAAALLWTVVLQYVLFAVCRAELYPAVALPGFPAECPGCPLESGQPTTKVTTLSALFADGHTQQVPLTTLMPPGPPVRLAVIYAAFEHDPVRTNPDAVKWLHARVDQLFPHDPPVEVDVVWRTATYPAADESRTRYEPLRTTHIAFGPQA